MRQHGHSSDSDSCKSDKFKVNSIPKETMKKVFGIETSHIGYIKPESSFRYRKVLSNEPRQPCSTFCLKSSLSR